MPAIRIVAAAFLFLGIGLGLSLEPSVGAAPRSPIASAGTEYSFVEQHFDWKVTAGRAVTSILLPGAAGDLDPTFNGTGRHVWRRLHRSGHPE